MSGSVPGGIVTPTLYHLLKLSAKSFISLFWQNNRYEEVPCSVIVNKVNVRPNSASSENIKYSGLSNNLGVRRASRPHSQKFAYNSSRPPCMGIPNHQLTLNSMDLHSTSQFNKTSYTWTHAVQTQFRLTLFRGQL